MWPHLKVGRYILFFKNLSLHYLSLSVTAYHLNGIMTVSNLSIHTFLFSENDSWNHFILNKHICLSGIFNFMKIGGWVPYTLVKIWVI